MSNDPDSLQRSLAQLHTELAGAHRLDAKSRQLLRSVLGDIERLLREGSSSTSTAAASTAAASTAAAPTAAASTAQSAPHRLEALAVSFEADHPSLAASVRQFIDLLGRAGL